MRTCFREGMSLICPVFSTMSSSCRDCQRDATLWQTLHLDKSVSLDELLDISQVSMGLPGSREQGWGAGLALRGHLGASTMPYYSSFFLAVH